MPLWKGRQAPSKPLARRRRRRDKWTKEYIALFLGLLAIVGVLSLLSFALYDRQIATPRLPIATVNDVTLDARLLVRELKWQGAQATTLDQILNMLDPLVANMENLELIRQESLKLGLSTTKAEVDQFIQQQFLKEGEQASQAEARYQEQLLQLQLTDAEYRTQVERLLLAEKLSQQLLAQLPKEAEQVHLHILQVADLALAEELRARLEAGEDFASLAQTYSFDPDSGPKGGEVGWRPRGARPYLDEVAFSLELNQISNLILGPQSSFFLIKITGKEVRPLLDEEARKEMEANALSLWLSRAREENKVERHLDNPKVIKWVLEQVKPRQG